MSNKLPPIVDAHCHWSDARVFADAPVRLREQLQKGLAGFLLGGVEPGEWQRQTALQSLFPGVVWRAFGLHPYFTSTAEPEVLRAAWSTLRASVNDLEALGEMGLDFRTPYLSRGKVAQMTPFVEQLELAQDFNKPVILHVVRAHSEALKELKNFTVRGMVHAFTGGQSVAELYLAQGLHLSFGTRVLYPQTEGLQETILKTPLERILIESDCPDQPPPGQNAHDSTTVWAVAERIAVIKNLPLTAVVEQTRQNLLNLIGKDLKP